MSTSRAEIQFEMVRPGECFTSLVVSHAAVVVTVEAVVLRKKKYGNWE